jgi:TonB family protein
MTALAQALSAALLHFVWQGSVVAILLSAALFLLRKRPAAWRYVASCVALALLAALPPATAWILARGAGGGGRGVPFGPGPAPFGPGPVRATAAYFFATVAPAAQGPAAAVSWLDRVESWALPVWSLGVLLLSLRLVWGARQLYGLRRRGEPATGPVLTAVARLGARMGVRRPVAVWISALADGPSVVGWIRPLILLPSATLLGLTPEQLEAVLAHEMAHIRRFDYAVNLLQMLIETLLFYHPAVWWVSARMRHERELCCDDLAVESCDNALCYARALTRLERLRLVAPGMAMASTGGPLLYRIQRLMGAAGPEYRPSRLPAILAVCLGLGCLALNVHWARAQEKPPEQPKQQEPATVTVTKDGKSMVVTLRNGVKEPQEQAHPVTFYMAADPGRTAKATFDGEPGERGMLVPEGQEQQGTIGVAEGRANYVFIGRGEPHNDRGIQVDTGGATVLKSEPVRYPYAAVEKNIQGTVVVEVTLDGEGEVSDAHVVSGPAELRKAALESLLNWRFVSDYAGTTRQVSIVFQVPANWRKRQDEQAKATTQFLREELQKAEQQLATFKQQHQGTLPEGANAEAEQVYTKMVAEVSALRASMRLAETQMQLQEQLQKQK